MTILLLAALPFSLFGQNATVIASFMKVTPGLESEYLEVEQTWKELHQRAVNEEIYSSWQLYRKLHTGTEDPYEYITLQWYDNYEAYLSRNISYEWVSEFYSEEQQAEIMEKTLAARKNIGEEVYHLVVTVDNPQPLKYLAIMRNHIPQDRGSEYFKMEKEIFKPYHEEMIRKEAMAQWGVWNAWPYKEGQAGVVIAEGFRDAKQLSDPGVDWSEVFAAVHPDLNWDEVVKEIRKNREQISVEVWELVDYVFAE